MTGSRALRKLAAVLAETPEKHLTTAELQLIVEKAAEDAEADEHDTVMGQDQ